MSLHKEFWGFLFLAFVGWIFISPNGQTRIQHACSPVGWTGNIAVSLTALVLPKEQNGVKEWTGKAEYGCEYAVWRLFYQQKYNDALKQAQGQAPAAAKSQAPASSGTAVSSSPAGTKGVLP